jgi:hypothetical protein
MHIMTREGTAPGSQFVDVGRVNVVGTETFELGTQVVDADEQDVGALRAGDRSPEPGTQKED